MWLTWKDEGDRAYADSTCVSIKCILGAYKMLACVTLRDSTVWKSESDGFCSMSFCQWLIHFQDMSL